VTTESRVYSTKFMKEVPRS